MRHLSNLEIHNISGGFNNDVALGIMIASLPPEKRKKVLEAMFMAYSTTAGAIAGGSTCGFGLAAIIESTVVITGGALVGVVGGGALAYYLANKLLHG